MDITKKKMSCFILSVSLVACGGGGGEPSPSNANNTEEQITSINLSTAADLSKLKVGQEATIEAICPCNGKNSDISSMGVWSVDNKEVAQISSSGKLVLLKYGYFEIKFQYKGKYSNNTIRFKPSTEVEDVNIQQSNLNSYVGEKIQLAYGAFDFLGKNVNQPLNWLSSDSNIVTVDESGAIESLREGDAVISVSFNNRKDQVTVKVHKKMTLVKGIIEGDISWNISDSPYQIDGILQIPYNSKLTINEGVIVYGKIRQNPTTERSRFGENPYSPEIGVWGGLFINGTKEQPVSINNAVFAQKKGEDKGRSFIGRLDAQNTRFQSSAFGFSSGNTFIRDSEIIDSYGPSIASPQVFNEPNSVITGNLFKSHRGIYLDPSKDISFTNNKFINSSLSEIELRPIYTTKKLIFKNNSFDSKNRVYCNNEGSTSDPNYKIDVSNNYWGTTDTAQISDILVDKFDNLKYSCELVYSPFLSSAP